MYKKDLNTDSGMWALWDYEAYKDVDEFDKWEALFCEDEDILKQIAKNTFVPINIFSDGVCSFTLKIDEGLSEREQKYACTESEEYLFRSSGKAVLSGIECVDASVGSDEAVIFDLPEGCYSVKIYIIAWTDEPGMLSEDGEASPDALSDFVVILKTNADASKEYRKKIETFTEDE